MYSFGVAAKDQNLLKIDWNEQKNRENLHNGQGIPIQDLRHKKFAQVVYIFNHGSKYLPEINLEFWINVYL